VIKGRKEAGFGLTFNVNGGMVEIPHQQCAHCQAVFPYYPREQDKTAVFDIGTKTWIKVDTGFCMRCMAKTCMSAECNKSCPGPFELRAQ
jgi:hypothetical protein